MARVDIHEIECRLSNAAGELPVGLPPEQGETARDFYTQLRTVYSEGM